MPGSREWRWGYLRLSYGSEHVLVDLCDVGGQCLAVGCGGGHVVVGLYDGGNAWRWGMVVSMWFGACVVAAAFSQINSQ